MTKKKKRRKKDNRIPILPTVGFGAGLLLAKPKGWSSPLETIQRGDMKGAFQTAIFNLTGIGLGIPGTGYDGPPIVELARILNPFDLEIAAAPKMLLWGVLGSKIMTKVGVNRALKKIPVVGKYIKL